MQAHILCSRQTLASAALFASVAFTPATLWAQGASGNVPNDYYRAELVILQRLVDPAGIEEQMANKSVEPVEEAGKTLWVEQESGGERVTELNLVPPRNQLHLGEAANRLERSGNYRVLASAGWYEAFRPTTRANLCVSQSVTGWPSPASERWKARSPLTASATCTSMCSLTTGPSATIPRLCQQSLKHRLRPKRLQNFPIRTRAIHLIAKPVVQHQKAPVPLTNSVRHQ